jgi:hypothetical protein
MERYHYLEKPKENDLNINNPPKKSKEIKEKTLMLMLELLKVI